MKRHQFIFPEDLPYVIVPAVAFAIAGVGAHLLRVYWDQAPGTVRGIVIWMIACALILALGWTWFLHRVAMTRRCPSCSAPMQRMPMKDIPWEGKRRRQHFWCEHCGKTVPTGVVEIRTDGKSEGDSLIGPTALDAVEKRRD